MYLHFDLISWYQQNIGSVRSIEQRIKVAWPNYYVLCLQGQEVLQGSLWCFLLSGKNTSFKVMALFNFAPRVLHYSG